MAKYRVIKVPTTSRMAAKIYPLGAILELTWVQANYLVNAGVLEEVIEDAPEEKPKRKKAKSEVEELQIKDISEVIDGTIDDSRSEQVGGDAGASGGSGSGG